MFNFEFERIYRRQDCGVISYQEFRKEFERISRDAQKLYGDDFSKYAIPEWREIMTGIDHERTGNCRAWSE